MADYSFTNLPALLGVAHGHHIVTQNAINNSPMLQLMQQQGLINFRDYYTNGVPLFTSVLASFEDGSAAHIGNHPYLRAFQNQLFAEMDVRFGARASALFADAALSGAPITLDEARVRAAAEFV